MILLTLKCAEKTKERGMRKWMLISAIVLTVVMGGLRVSAQQDSAQAIGPYPHIGKSCVVSLVPTGGTPTSVAGTILQLNDAYLTLSTNENRDVVWVNTSQIAYVSVSGMGPAAPAR